MTRAMRWLAALALGIAALLSVAAVPATSCRQPDPWFVEHVRVTDPGQLPAGISTRAKGNRMFLINQGRIPLYLIGEVEANFVAPPDDDPLPVTLPPGQGPLLRAEEGRVFALIQQRALDQNGQPMWEWKELDAEDALAALSVDSKRGILWAPVGIVGRYPSANRNDEPRPADVTLPPSQPTTILLVQGQQPITLPLTVSYHLNPEYDPYGYGADACRFFPWLDKYIWACLCLFVIGGGWLLWWVINRSIDVASG